MRQVASGIAYVAPQFRSSSSTSIATTISEIIRNTTGASGDDDSGVGFDGTARIPAAEGGPPSGVDFGFGGRGLSRLGELPFLTFKIPIGLLVASKGWASNRGPQFEGSLIGSLTYKYKRKRGARVRDRGAVGAEFFATDSSASSAGFVVGVFDAFESRKISSESEVVAGGAIRDQNALLVDRRVPPQIPVESASGGDAAVEREAAPDHRVRPLARRFNVRFRRQTVSRENHGVGGDDAETVSSNCTRVDSTTAAQPDSILAHNSSVTQMTTHDSSMETGKCILTFGGSSNQGFWVCNRGDFRKVPPFTNRPER